MDEKNLIEIGEKAVKHKRPNRSEAMKVHTEPGDNTKYLNHSLRLAELSTIDIKNPEQIAKRVTEYFTICAEDDMKPSVAGLAVAIGTDRRRLWEWANTEKSDRTDVIKKAYALLDLQINNYMMNGKINPVSGIFLMKNHFGYADKQEVVVTPNNPLGEQKTTEELEQRYLDSVVDENLTE